jgi:hypothetical protein
MIHHSGQHDNSPLRGAIFGMIGSIYGSLNHQLGMITFGGLIETALYAVIGSALGAIASFYVNRLLNKLNKEKK